MFGEFIAKTFDKILEKGMERLTRTMSDDEASRLSSFITDFTNRSAGIKDLFRTPELKQVVRTGAVEYANSFFEPFRKSYDFFTGKLVSNKIQERNPGAYISIKKLLNAHPRAFAETMTREVNLLQDIRPEHIDEARNILMLQDAIRELASEKKIPDISKYIKTDIQKPAAELTLDDLANAYKNSLSKATPEAKKIVREFVNITNEIGYDKDFNFYDLDRINEEFLKKIRGEVEDPMTGEVKVTHPEREAKFKELLKNASDNLGIEVKPWNFYFPHLHMSEFEAVLNKKPYILNTFVPFSVKDRKAFFEKSRSKFGTTNTLVDDLPLVMRTLTYQAQYIKNYRKAIQSLLLDSDIISKMTAKEAQDPEVLNFIKRVASDRRTGNLIQMRDIPEALKKFIHPDEEGVMLWDMASLLPKSSLSENAVESYIKDIMERITNDKIGRIYIVPYSLKDIFFNLNKYIFGDTNVITDVLSNLSKYTTTWKKAVTVWGRFAPFRLTNTMGDMFNMTMFQPGAITKVGKAFKIMSDLIIKHKMPDESITSLMTNEEFLSKLDEHGVIQGILREFGGDIYNPILDVKLKKQIDLLGESMQEMFSAGELNIGKSKTVEEAIKKVFGDAGLLDRVSVFMESIPKLASVLDNIERVEKGLMPDLSGAEKYITSLAKQNRELEAVFERGATITVDYTAIPPNFRKYFSQGLFPFSYWYARTFDKLASSLFDKSMQKRWLYFYVFPLVAAYLWNHSTDEKKAIFDSLPPWLKYAPFTIIAGIDNKSQKPIVYSLYTPADYVADFLGFDRVVEAFDKYHNGLISEKDILPTLFGEIPIDAMKQITNFSSPIIQGFIGAATNRDLFTDRPLVSEDLKDTPIGLSKRMNYFINQSFLSPIMPMMQASNYKEISNFIDDNFNLKKGEGIKLFNTIKNFATQWVDVYRGLGFMDVGSSGASYVNSAALSYQKELLKQKDSYMQKALNAYLDGDMEEFNSRREEAYSGKLKFINGAAFDAYFQQPSVIRKIKAQYAKNRPTKEEQDRLQQLNDQERTYQLIEKETEKFLRPELRYQTQTLYDILSGKND